jgi:hypothetical protein
MARTLIVAIVAALASASCGEAVRTGRSPSMLVLNSIEAANGDDAGSFFGFLLSDVQTIVEQQISGQTVRVPTVFNDPGRAEFRIQLKNTGTPLNPIGPTGMNDVTLTSYRIEYRRSDGRNRHGVDVPYPVSGGLTVTVPSNGTAQAAFDLVRHQSKMEPPLRNLIGSGGAIFIDTIAEVTFFGRDQAGNEVQAAGNIHIRFGDFGDE